MGRYAVPAAAIRDAALRADATISTATIPAMGATVPAAANATTAHDIPDAVLFGWYAVTANVWNKCLKVLVLCEFSGIVREAFAELGHDAWSLDILPSEQGGKHIQLKAQLMPRAWYKQFDLLIAHPPCTHLAVSGARWWKDKQSEQMEALTFVRWIFDLPVPRLALENPVSIISSAIRKPDQIIQPWQFGHGETKATCLWLRGCPLLIPTKIVEGREARVHREPQSRDRWKHRSRTYEGIAKAMANQWGT